MRQSAVVAVLRIGTRGVDSAPHRAFFRAPPYGDISNCLAPYGAIKTSSRKPPQATRGSASRNGEARRECAGKAEQSECRAREDYGWGRAGGVTKPYQATRPTPPPPKHTRQREPAGRSPARSAGKAERSECRAREDYGWGRAGRFNQTVPPTPPKTRPPIHPRQREPAGRSPARSAGKAAQSARRAREDYGWGRAGGVTKPNHATHPTPRLHHTRGSPSRTAPPPHPRQPKPHGATPQHPRQHKPFTSAPYRAFFALGEPDAC